MFAFFVEGRNEEDLFLEKDKVEKIQYFCTCLEIYFYCCGCCFYSPLNPHLTRQVDVVLCLSLINAVFVNSIALLLLLILPIALVAWQLEIGSINLVLRDFPAITH